MVKSRRAVSSSTVPGDTLGMRLPGSYTLVASTQAQCLHATTRVNGLLDSSVCVSVSVSVCVCVYVCVCVCVCVCVSVWLHGT